MRDHPLVQLTLSQLRGFYREPEAVFWVFGFPILLAFALGIAFRNRGPEALQVGVVAGAGDSAVVASLAASPHLAVQHVQSNEGQRRLAGFMLRRQADRVHSSHRTGRSIILFHFDH